MLGPLRTRKFIVEVVRTLGPSEEILARIPIEEESHDKASAKARLMLAPWRAKGATATRVRPDRTTRTNST